jgi:cell division GTPase FtsZ
MKPSDRALDLAVVGLGQAGGNLATEFARIGYRALALNTAHTDLSTLAPGNREFSLPAESRIYVGIDGYDGAGADMNYGRECIQESASRIREAVSNHAQGADVVVLTAGLGGGTGSAVTELVRVLSSLELPIIVLATLPNEHESGIAKVNAVRAVSDLVKQSNIGWIFADNSRLSRAYGGVSLDKYFEKINSVIIHPLDALNRQNYRPGVHPIRTLDGEDFRALLLSKGVINYAENSLTAFTVEGVLEKVRENLVSNTMMPAGFAAEEISYMGVVLEASDEVLRGTPFSFYEQLNEHLKDETGGGAIYMGVYRRDKATEGGAATMRMIISTQSLPEGVQAIVNDARREGGTLRDKLHRSMSTLDLGEIEDFDLFKTTTRTGQSAAPASKRRPAQPDLGMPEPVAPRASRPVTASRAASIPAPGASMSPRPPVVAAKPAAWETPTTVEPAGEPAPGTDPSATTAGGSTTDYPEMKLTLPAHLDIEGDAERKAEAASYAKLVSTFVRTDFESTRKRVARRLQAARTADDEITRYLAEAAVARLREEGQYAAFEDALNDSATVTN